MWQDLWLRLTGVLVRVVRPWPAWAHSHTSTALAAAAEIAAAHGSLPGVVAVAMAGSAATAVADDRSDIDLYAYAAEPLDLTARAAVAARFATSAEVGNAFWEPGDEWVDDATGRHVDVMHRTPVWIEEQLDRVFVRHEAAVGYTTCFWHNVLHSVPLFDREGGIASGKPPRGALIPSR